ncbi:MAG: S8 family peptidase [Bacteroidia bacterium]|jgi:subtilisin family serine protease|nr:S8 family peptidase [Bacteroidia bacterium]
MHKLIVVFLFCVLINLANSQQVVLSPNLKLYLLKKDANHTPMVYSKTGDGNILSLLIKTDGTINAGDIRKVGAIPGTKAGNIFTVQCHEKNIQQLAKLRGITYIQLDEPITFNMDLARRAARVDSVHQGIQLAMPYSGKNVVVGIIDAGFDYTHPAFYDTTGSKLRVKRVWEQHKPGTPPQGYSYGNELKDSAGMMQAMYDVNTFSHGAHVGGIAAGSGYGSANNSQHRGVAYESDLVFVGIKPEKSEWKTMGMASIVDAINYIFKYAESVGKPAVVNLSWGCSIGPNDGSSLVSEAIDNLTGPGKIFVNSAGNNGDEKIHLMKSFTSTDTTLFTYATIPTVLGEKRSWIDTWGMPGETFEISLQLYQLTNAVAQPLRITLNQSVLDTFLIGSDGDTLFIKASGNASDFNNKPHILLDVYNKSTNSILFGIKANKGLVHSWMGYVHEYNGHYGSFDKGSLSFTIDGDNKYTLGEMSCTRSALTVAAWVSKNQFRNLAGGTVSYTGYAGVGFLAPFSSRGPTVDGRIKPDIAAPGMTIASSVNSFDVSYAQGGGNYQMSVQETNWNNRTYYYAEASGTSMSAPMASGIVALMLQVNPMLGPDRIKQILFETAIKDNRTTANPDSSRWGYGKINAYGAIKRALLSTGKTTIVTNPELHLNIYPNPSQGKCNLALPASTKEIKVQVFDMSGRLVYQKSLSDSAPKQEYMLELTGLREGLYMIYVASEQFKVSQKLVINTLVNE